MSTRTKSEGLFTPTWDLKDSYTYTLENAINTGPRVHDPFRMQQLSLRSMQRYRRSFLYTHVSSRARLLPSVRTLIIEFVEFFACERDTAAVSPKVTPLLVPLPLPLPFLSSSASSFFLHCLGHPFLSVSAVYQRCA